MKYDLYPIVNCRNSIKGNWLASCRGYCVVLQERQKSLQQTPIIGMRI